MDNLCFSIVIPHYNIPDLLMRCLKSIPVSPNFQVIVVDDCSPGAENYLTKYPELSRPFLEFYSTSKGGSAGRARNVGIDHAKGKWIIFIDADDFLVENAAELLLKYQDSTEDILYFPSLSVMSDNIRQPSDRNPFLYHFSRYHSARDEKPLRFEFDAPWGKVIRKALIDQYDIRFDEVRYSNDTYFSAVIGYYAKNVKVPLEPLYVVTKRIGSLTSAKKKSDEEWTTRFNAALHVQSFFDEHNVKYKRYAFADFLIQKWKSDKRRYFREMMKLSFRNKCRVIYSQIRCLK